MLGTVFISKLNLKEIIGLFDVFLAILLYRKMQFPETCTCKHAYDISCTGTFKTVIFDSPTRLHSQNVLDSLKPIQTP